MYPEINQFFLSVCVCRFSTTTKYYYYNYSYYYQNIILGPIMFFVIVIHSIHFIKLC